MMTTIRPYAAADLPRLTAVHNQIDPERPFTPAEMAAFLAGAHCWLALDGREIVGYAAVTPAPGLPGDSDLHGGVLPAHRRRGIGGQLLQTVLAELTAVGLSRTSGVVDELDAPLAHFLLAHGFSQDHEEVTLVWKPPPAFTSPRWPDGSALNRYPLAAAITHFRSLYEAAFQPHRWYQPYETAELSHILQGNGRSPDEIIFLEHEGRPVGFIWAQPQGLGDWQIEPVAIHPDYQRRGWGQRLLQAGLLEASAQGVSQVTITLWRENQAAYHLYQQVGFVEDGRRYYLTFSVKSEM
jgi:ribosomal protein S18 acetylase RimI-like enzyme